MSHFFRFQAISGDFSKFREKSLIFQIRRQNLKMIFEDQNDILVIFKILNLDKNFDSIYALKS